MDHEEHIRLCDDCGSLLVHGICPLCGHRELEDRPDGTAELDFKEPDDLPVPLGHVDE